MTGMTILESNKFENVYNVILKLYAEPFNPPFKPFSNPYFIISFGSTTEETLKKTIIIDSNTLIIHLPFVFFLNPMPHIDLHKDIIPNSSLFRFQIFNIESIANYIKLRNLRDLNKI